MAKQEKDPETTDMTMGIYRRIYAGYTTSRRFSSLSDDAEIAFWRLHAIADDFGNLLADPLFIKANAFLYKKTWAQDRIEVALKELIAAKLIYVYEVNGEGYFHIIDFVRRQPKNKNGKRIQRHPMHTYGDNGDGSVNPGESGFFQINPDESKKIRVNPGESGLIQNNPGESKFFQCSDTDTEAQSESDTDTQHDENSDEVVDNSSEVEPTTKKPAKVRVGWTEDGWDVPTTIADAWAQANPGVDVRQQMAKAHAWLLANPHRRPRASGFGRFMTNWLSRAETSATTVQAPIRGSGFGYTRNGVRIDQATIADLGTPLEENIAAMKAVGLWKGDENGFDANKI